jgi:hypothetical protein
MNDRDPLADFQDHMNRSEEHRRRAKVAYVNGQESLAELHLEHSKCLLELAEVDWTRAMVESADRPHTIRVEPMWTPA